MSVLEPGIVSFDTPEMDRGLAGSGLSGHFSRPGRNRTIFRFADGGRLIGRRSPVMASRMPLPQGKIGFMGSGKLQSNSVFRLRGIDGVGQSLLACPHVAWGHA